MFLRDLKEFTLKFKGELNLLLVTLFWSATFVLIKDAIQDVSSMLFIAIRFFIASVLLFVWKGKTIIKNFRGDILPPILLSFLLFIAFATQTIGLKFTLATKSAFITGSSVIMIPFFQTFIEGKIPSRGTTIGAVLVFIGILLLSSGGGNLTHFLNSIGGNFNIGDALTLICAIFYSIYVVYLDILSKRYEFWVLVFIQLFVMAVLSLFFGIGFYFLNVETLHIQLTQNLIIAVLYTSLFATLIATALQTKFQKLVTPAKAGIIFSFEPVFAATIAFFTINEKISNFGVVGSLLIFSGLIVSEILNGR